MKAPRVQLMATCLADAFFDDVARATVEVLEHLGCEVALSRGPDLLRPAGVQQRGLAGRPQRGAPLLARVQRRGAGGGPLRLVRAHGVARRALALRGRARGRSRRRGGARRSGPGSWAISSCAGWGWRAGRGASGCGCAFHRSCHSRGTAYAEGALTLLRSIDGRRGGRDRRGGAVLRLRRDVLRRLPAHLARRWGRSRSIMCWRRRPTRWSRATRAASCTSAGLADRTGRPLRTLHLAQVLRDALRAARRGQRVSRP